MDTSDGTRIEGIIYGNKMSICGMDFMLIYLRIVVVAFYIPLSHIQIQRTGIIYVRLCAHRTAAIQLTLIANRGLETRLILI